MLYNTNNRQSDNAQLYNLRGSKFNFNIYKMLKTKRLRHRKLLNQHSSYWGYCSPCKTWSQMLLKTKCCTNKHLRNRTCYTSTSIHLDRRPSLSFTYQIQFLPWPDTSVTHPQSKSDLIPAWTRVLAWSFPDPRSPQTSSFVRQNWPNSWILPKYLLNLIPAWPKPTMNGFLARQKPNFIRSWPTQWHIRKHEELLDPVSHLKWDGWFQVLAG